MSNENETLTDYKKNSIVILYFTLQQTSYKHEQNVVIENVEAILMKRDK